MCIINACEENMKIIAPNKHELCEYIESMYKSIKEATTYTGNQSYTT